jgi:quercetin dioxygenase-like cupin family protein
MTTTHPSPTPFLIPQQRVDQLRWQPFPGSTGVDNKVIYDLEHTVAGLLRLRPGAEEIRHLHLHGEHHLWVLEGAINVDDTELSAASYVHIPARLRHTIGAGAEGALVFYVFCPSDD